MLLTLFHGQETENALFLEQKGAAIWLKNNKDINFVLKNLLTDENNNERLNTLVKTNDGFEIAEADLLQRGSGNLVGTEQSGMNKYINEMLQYPNMYKHIKETAKFCNQHGYASELIRRYMEHEDYC